MGRSQRDILEHDFLEIRCKILDIAAALDRIDRGTPPDVASDPRMEQLRNALHALLETAPRAEKVQMIFSRPYEPNWMAKLLPERNQPASQ